MTKKIVVTGIGATSPLGGTAVDSWANLLAGQSGITTLEQDWVAKYELPVTIAGQARTPSADVLDRRETKRRARPGPTRAPLRSSPSASASTGPPASAASGPCSTPGTPSGRRAPAGSCP